MTDAREWLESDHANLDRWLRTTNALLAVLDLTEPTVQQYRHTRSGYDEGAMDLAGAIEEAINQALGVSDD